MGDSIHVPDRSTNSYNDMNTKKKDIRVMAVFAVLVIMCLIGQKCHAQTNVIFGYSTDITGQPPQAHLTATATLLSPNPRNDFNQQSFQQFRSTPINQTNGYYSFTNLVYGYYSLTISGPYGTTFHFWVSQGNVGTIPIGSLISNDDTAPPNPGTNYYTTAQIDALLASTIPFALGTVPNGSNGAPANWILGVDANGNTTTNPASSLGGGSATNFALGVTPTGSNGEAVVTLVGIGASGKNTTNNSVGTIVASSFVSPNPITVAGVVNLGNGTNAGGFNVGGGQTNQGNLVVIGPIVGNVSTSTQSTNAINATQTGTAAATNDARVLWETNVANQFDGTFTGSGSSLSSLPSFAVITNSTSQQNIYSSMYVLGSFEAQNILVQASYALLLGGSAQMIGNGQGIEMENNAGNGFSDLWLGLPTSSWPQFKVSTGPPTVTLIAGDGLAAVNLAVTGTQTNAGAVTLAAGATNYSATAAIQSPQFVGGGAAITSLAAGNITPGGTLPALNGAALTSLTGANVSGQVPSAIDATIATNLVTGSTATNLATINLTNSSGASFATGLTNYSSTQAINSSGGFVGSAAGLTAIPAGQLTGTEPLGAVNANVQTNNIITPVNQGSIGSVNMLTPAGMQLQPQVDLSGPISINANPTGIGLPVGFSPANTNYPGGEVQILGTAFGSGDSNPAVTTNGSLITADTSGGFPAYLGFHASGGSVTFTRFRGAPDATAPGSSVADEIFMEGVGYGTCTDTSFDGKVPYGATPVNPVQPTMYWWNRYQYTEITNGFPFASSAFAYLAFTNSYLAIAQQQWIGYGTTVACPVAPVISPWGGHYPNVYPYYGSIQVTLSSISTAASIYYTLDGTLPTGPGHGTLYSGPFILNCASANTITNPINLMAMSYQANLSQPASAISSNALFYSTGYVPQDTYRDQNGNVCELHTPCIMPDFVNGHGILVYGNNFNVAMNGLSGAGLNTVTGIGENCYSTIDMLNFIYLGQIYGIPSSAMNLNQNANGFGYRFHAAFNPQYHYYVGWNFLGGGSGQYADGVLTNSTPNGSWNYANTNCKPFGATSYGDLNLFPYNGGCYLLQNSNPPTGGVWITKLDQTWTTNVGSWVNIYPNYGEAPSIIATSWGFIAQIQVKGNYNNATLPMFVTNFVCIGSNPLGTWYPASSLFNTEPIYLGTTPTNLYNGQSGGVFQSPWNTNQLMYVSDFFYNGGTAWWNPLLGSYQTNVTINPADGTNGVLDSSRLVILPLSLSNTNLSAVTNGNWSLQEWNKIFNIPGASIINIGGTNVNHTLINFTPVGAQLYTNTYGNIIQVSGTANLTTAAVVGISQLAIECPGNTTNYATMPSAITGLFTGTVTNMTMGSIEVPNGGVYSFTNRSAGAGDVSTPGPAQIMVY